MASISERENQEIEAAKASGKTPVVFIHGLWLLPSSWDRWAALFEEAGYTALTPGWPDDPETVEEAKVILLFHVAGTAMEVFKTAVGSWIYPEPSLLRIGGVPLFTGFMYAAVGSYIARVWRLFDFRFTRHPPLWATTLLAVGIYANFFAHHYGPDLRIALFGLAALLFGRTSISYKPWRRRRAMPLLLACFLNALFIWIAENVGTFTRAWLYPTQLKGWAFVGLGKLGSWFLLLIISYVMVCWVNEPEEVR